MELDRSSPGQCYLPDKEFRSDLLHSICIEGLVISANLCISLCSSDYIFNLLFGRCLAYSL